MEIKTVGDAWKVLKEHGLEGKYCPHCDQFAQARVLLKQDEKISDLHKACKEALEYSIWKGYDKLTIALKKALAKAAGGK